MNSNQENWISCIDHPNFIEISQVMAASDIKGKGEFYIHNNQDPESNYLIACTKYGNSFVCYKVNVPNQSIELVSGNGITHPYPNPLNS